MPFLSSDPEIFALGILHGHQKDDESSGHQFPSYSGSARLFLLTGKFAFRNPPA
jgi:hypothetical protein